MQFGNNVYYSHIIIIIIITTPFTRQNTVSIPTSHQNFISHKKIVGTRSWNGI